ncbi:MAG: GDP-mannose 4,6-dehydratase [Candidatus Sungbacteria bacterium]|nr:GDP-mannose 4,6-dehydratase [Candidatus Sungbacteria bacterium]
MKKKKAFITGIAGQDGSYLAELLLKKGYEVHGLLRRVAVEDHRERLSRLQGSAGKIRLHAGDVSDYPTVWRLIASIKPDEVYHLAAQSFVGESFTDPISTMRINIDGTAYLLSAIKELHPVCRFYFAATSEMFGRVLTSPQNEETPFNPVSPYGISKLAGFYLVRMYREGYGLFAVSGILFNHESPRRGHEFVTRKITHTAARIKLGLEKELRLGNLDAKRDWGYAGDYVEAMWRMLQQKTPRDFVIGSGETHTVREFVEETFGYLGLDWKKYVKIDKAFFRPVDVHLLLADAARARRALGWKPKTGFRALVRMMVDSDMKLAQERTAK